MWLQLTKYLFYLSFFLNIVCGVWVFFGIIQWLRFLNRRVSPLPPEKAATRIPLKRGEPSPSSMARHGGRFFCSGANHRTPTGASSPLSSMVEDAVRFRS